jgi:cell division protein FtsQ
MQAQIVKYSNLLASFFIVLFILAMIFLLFNPYFLSNLFRIENISISGSQKSNSEDLRIIIANNFNSLITLDKNKAQDILEEFEWIKRANIQKIYPNTLKIQIIESDPFALFNVLSYSYLIDIEGNIITYNPDLSVYKNFLIVRGEKGQQNLKSLVKDISINFPEIKSRIRELEFIDERRWNLLINENLLIKLPDSNVGKSLLNLKELFDNENILESNIIEIDLRIEDRAIIKVDGDQISFGLEEV